MLNWMSTETDFLKKGNKRARKRTKTEMIPLKTFLLFPHFKNNVMFSTDSDMQKKETSIQKNEKKKER